ncbi:WbqC family protein [Chitinophaga sedimenti]|uniref:WbqC family protein n=1 Tax=Chitinophaga sedimenti TaxID=2033606 RepID=UPI002002A435|nr:WbqC family protein [Chitinophaga sedimenti]MCK7553874.1 WbqC family protein [Chitinophaga sedimenti]
MSEQVHSNCKLVDSQYFGSIEYYKTLIDCDILQIERYEHYQKVSFRNRCYIAGPNGRILLSVPLVKGKNQRTTMKDVRISDAENWQALHWKTLVSAYRRSPWFEYFEGELQSLYEKKFEYLLDWNMACSDWVNERIGFERTVIFTDSYQDRGTVKNAVDLRDQLTPPGDQDENAGIENYTQVFQERVGFLRNLSILDLLFCEGKRSLELLAQK